MTECYKLPTKGERIISTREASFNNLTPESKANVEPQQKRFGDQMNQMSLYYTILKVANT
jgi:hypothetical protein